MFWSSKPSSPITEEDENWIISSYDWFLETFGEKETFVPNEKFLGFRYTGTEDDLLAVVTLVAKKMEIDPGSIEVYFFEEAQPIEFSDEGLYTSYEEGTTLVNGEYSKEVDGLYQIGLERHLLGNPVKLIATIAHELAHIKLLGEERLEDNDEHLTDLTACLFGFVVFLANASISKMETWAGNTHTGWKITGAAGYVHYKVYAFLIAYQMHKRKEEAPAYLLYLDKEIQKEVQRAFKYLKAKQK